MNEGIKKGWWVLNSLKVLRSEVQGYLNSEWGMRIAEFKLAAGTHKQIAKKGGRGTGFIFCVFLLNYYANR
jgi:hypothetical protein